MDPRLNPNLRMQQRPGLMHDIKPPPAPAAPQPAPSNKQHQPSSSAPAAPQPPAHAIPAPAATAPAPKPQTLTASTPAPAMPKAPLKAEIVASIPVRQPGQSDAPKPVAAAPVVQMPGYSPDASAQPEDELDKILQAVNNRVKAPVAPATKPKKEVAKKVSAKLSSFKNKAASHRPVGAMVVVIFIALILSITAVFAYRQGNKDGTLAKQPGKVGTSYQAGDSIQAAGGTLVRPSDLDDFSMELQTKLNSLNDKQDFDTNSLSDQVLGL